MLQDIMKKDEEDMVFVNVLTKSSNSFVRTNKTISVSLTPTATVVKLYDLARKINKGL